MSNRTLTIDDQLYEYMLQVSMREPEILTRLREETSRHKLANMQISPEQGQFMAMLARLTGAERYLEVGTFTGYSSTVMALTMPATAEVICCDISEEFTDIARRYWEEAAVTDRITLHLGPADKTLARMIDEGRDGAFDLVFIDADKIGYDTYYELGLKLVRPGGLIMIDNVLWSGEVANPAMNDSATEAIRAINAKIVADNRVELSLVPIGDGLTLAQKR